MPDLQSTFTLMGQAETPQGAPPPSATAWKVVQDSLTLIAGQALGRYAYPDARTPHTPISLDHPVCQLMRAQAETASRCAAQCDDGVSKTMGSGRTQLFQCHASLSTFITQIAPPGETGGHGLDVLIGGKTFKSYEDLHAFRTYAAELGVDQDALNRLIPDIHIVPLGDIKSFMEQARTVAASLAQVANERDGVQAQFDRIRYLMEIFPALDMEPAADLPRAVLHGLGILFNAPAGVVLGPGVTGGRASLLPMATFSGNGTRLSGALLDDLTVAAESAWLKPALEQNQAVYSDSVYDLLKTGFPSETTHADVFPLSGTDITRLVVLINTPLTPEDRNAIRTFCRYAALLLDRHFLSEKVDIEFPAGTTEVAPALWETDNLEALCQGILEKSIASVGAEQGSVMLLDPAENRLRIRAIHGVNLKYVEYIRIPPGEGIAGAVLQKGAPLLIPDISRDTLYKGCMRSRYRTRSLLSVPIQLNERSLGVINVTDKRSGGAFSRYDLKRLMPIAQQAALALDRMAALKKTEELRKASMTDELTGLFNRGAFDRRFKEEVSRAQRYPYANPFSLLVVDIDNFKRINDTYGYLVGDDCIRMCAQTLKAGTRTIDSVFRRGGEEFTVILPHTERAPAYTLAQRLCQAIAELRVTSRHTPTPVSFTISIGLSAYPDDGDGAEVLFKKANLALHYAKKLGKNQVIALSPENTPLAFGNAI